MWKYNKGEWSELYTFVYLLNSGVLFAADKDLNRIENVYFPILKIIREESPGEIIEFRLDDGIKIYKNDIFLKRINKIDLEEILNILLDEIPQGSRAFEIEGVEEFFNENYCTKVKSAASQKQDITLQIHDINTGIKPVCGFSIKSYLGANPTLINPGTNTNFVYTINNCNDQIMHEVNSIDTRQKLIDKMHKLIESGCTFTINENCISPQFIENLQFVDTVMPIFLNLMVLYSYQYSLRYSKDIINKMKELNPLNFSNTEMYPYKFKKLLTACALGLTPERSDWLGSEDANGGYITVKHDGDVVCYHLYNRKDFEEYLYEYTYFDKPSTSKYNYFNIYKDGNEYKLALCLQVRFK